ncbi:MAG: hypothetical protein JOZ99_03965 [Actinobacteria bacterium]|nr:hypothetical protein [Actinomycetota bacterium]
MSDKPTYLGLLNAIAVAESRAHEYLSAWADRSSNDDVRAVLRTVAAREGEHGMSFAKRVNELGYEVRVKDPDEGARAMAIATSDTSDLEKMKALELHRLDTGDRPDIFDNFFRDHSIDVRTGELLGRYIAEERDSARLFRSCYEQLARAAGEDDHRGEGLDELNRKVDGLCRAVEELRQIVCAQSMPATP